MKRIGPKRRTVCIEVCGVENQVNRDFVAHAIKFARQDGHKVTRYVIHKRRSLNDPVIVSSNVRITIIPDGNRRSIFKFKYSY